MSDALDQAITSLKLESVEQGTSIDGIDFFRVPVDAIGAVVDAIVAAGYSRFIDLTAVDDPHRPDRFELQYLFHSMREQRWLRVKARTAGGAPSIVDLAPGANWYEREVFDMFGVNFVGHPGLTRILMPDDWDGHPLRRDVALGGEPVEFSGDIR